MLSNWCIFSKFVRKIDTQPKPRFIKKLFLTIPWTQRIVLGHTLYLGLYSIVLRILREVCDFVINMKTFITIRI